MKCTSVLTTVLLFILLSQLSLSLVSAESGKDDQGNPNEPHDNERANACYEGSTLEGKCGDDPLMWVAGWYLIRFEYGILNRGDVPEWVSWVLPPLPPISSVSASGAATTCTIDVGGNNAGALGLTSSIVAIPLDVINGLSDPNATVGATPYGFDWNGIPSLTLYVPNAFVQFGVWSNDPMRGARWNAGIVSNTCPTPTPPV